MNNLVEKMRIHEEEQGIKLSVGKKSRKGYAEKQIHSDTSSSQNCFLKSGTHSVE